MRGSVLNRISLIISRKNGIYGSIINRVIEGFLLVSLFMSFSAIGWLISNLIKGLPTGYSKQTFRLVSGKLHFIEDFQRKWVLMDFMESLKTKS